MPIEIICRCKHGMYSHVISKRGQGWKFKDGYKVSMCDYCDCMNFRPRLINYDNQAQYQSNKGQNKNQNKNGKNPSNNCQ